MQRGNQRLPMLSILNKNENQNASKFKNKSQDQNMMIVDDNKNNIINMKTINKDERITNNFEISDKQMADGEFLKNVQKALHSAINENEDLRDKINLLINENKELKDEIDDKNFALTELAQYYEFCQKNHKFSMNAEREDPTDNNIKSTNKRRSNSL